MQDVFKTVSTCGRKTVASKALYKSYGTNQPITVLQVPSNGSVNMIPGRRPDRSFQFCRTK